jgi:hypothetical protein
MFDYEREIRIVYVAGTKVAENGLGHPLEWDAEETVEQVWVHPEADQSFKETVSATVAHYAPRLKDCVKWSAMRVRPPLSGGRRLAGLRHGEDV